MTTYIKDTIAAIATPSGRGGVGIVRISGPAAQGLFGRLIPPKALKPRQATHCIFKNHSGEVIDHGLAIFFAAPNSFTGEDVLELHGHGGAVVMDTLLKAVLAHDIRMAKPGEFSERAFLNDKLDLAQAEAIADLIDASTEAAARSAMRSLQGDFSAAIETLKHKIVQLRVFIEAAIDFSDEEIDFLSENKVADQTQALLDEIENILKISKQGALLKNGVQVVIAGPPNAGKSSLLNYLSKEEVAIVTPVPGTTRDMLHNQIHLDGLPLHITDTAGLRETEDMIEKAGIERAKAAISKADLILYVVDSSRPAENDLLDDKAPMIIVHNKIDLTQQEARTDQNQAFVSLKTGAGMEAFVNLLKEKVGYRGEHEGQFIARRRHLDALQRARASVERGVISISRQNTPELLAEDLHRAHNALCEITGAYRADDLLGEIFSNFCIGK